MSTNVGAGMPPSDRRRLVGILGRLGSEYAGERAAAGLLAFRLLQKAGLAWNDVLAAGTDETANAKPERPHRASFAADLELCELNVDRLTPWEQKFVLNLSKYDRKTPRQIGKVRQIAAELRARRQ